MRIALTRPVPESLARCELTHQSRVAIDVAVAAAQHQQYEDALRALGAPCATCRRPTICRTRCLSKTSPSCSTRSPSSPGPAPSRAGPSARPLPLSSPLRLLRGIDARDARRWGCAADWDGRVTSDCRAARTRTAHGSSPGTPHRSGTLSSACRPPHACTSSRRSRRSSRTASCATASIDTRVLRSVDVLAVDPRNRSPLTSCGSGVQCVRRQPRTDRRRPEGARLQRVTVEVSELAKAEAGVTCCSLIIDVSPFSRLTASSPQIWPTT